jgi:hypothetical protein
MSTARAHFASGNRPIPIGGNGRDGRGRFAPGNCGGPGRPPAANSHELKSAFQSCWTVEDMFELAHTLKSMIRQRNVRAIEIVLNRIFGPLSVGFTLGLAKEVPSPDDKFV